MSSSGLQLQTVDMSVNSSSSSNSPLNSLAYRCSNSTVFFSITAAFQVTRATLLLPLSIVVLHLGHRRWRQQHSSTSTSHSDIFTYHMAAMDLIWGLGAVLYSSSYFTDLPDMMIAATCLSSITFYGESFFHLLTCLERYLAVVHPVTYLGLRKARGVRIRNITIGCVWLISLAWMGITYVYYPILPTIPYFCPLVVCLVAISFCSLSILRVLIRPGPGDGGRDKKRVDQSKEKAFITITTIMGVLWLWFIALLVSTVLNTTPLLGHSVDCIISTSVLWFSLPSSSVLPLLYLHRAGILSCCCYNSE